MIRFVRTSGTSECRRWLGGRPASGDRDARRHGSGVGRHHGHPQVPGDRHDPSGDPQRQPVARPWKAGREAGRDDHMRGRTRVSLAIAVVAVGTVFGATSSLALTATTWTVKPGGSSSGATTLRMKDTKTGDGFACGSGLSVTFKSGSGLSGSNLGSVTSISAGSCDMPVGFGLTFSDLPYVFSADSYSAGTTTGRITGIHAMGSGVGCSFVIDGTGATADNGYTVVTYSNSTGKLQFEAGGNLHFYDVIGCYGLFGNGDHVNPQYSDPYKLSPQQTITSP